MKTSEKALITLSLATLIYQIVVIALKSLECINWGWEIVMLPLILLATLIGFLVVLGVLLSFVVSGRISKQKEAIDSNYYDDEEDKQ